MMVIFWSLQHRQSFCQTMTALLMVVNVNARDILVLDNFEYGGAIYGTRSDMADYVTLAKDPNLKLPSSFTICSSIKIKFLLTAQPFFILWSENLDSVVLNFVVRFQRNTEQFSEQFFATVGFESGLGTLNFMDVNVPIHPNSWYHACTGVDTLKGSFRIVVNGITIFDDTVEPIQQSLLPKSLEGKLNMLMTGRTSAFNYQTRGVLTNMNIYSSMLSSKNMTEITNTTDCARKGDYLAWSDMVLNFTGKVDRRSVNVEDELCYVRSSQIVFMNVRVGWNPNFDTKPHHLLYMDLEVDTLILIF